MNKARTTPVARDVDACCGSMLQSPLERSRSGRARGRVRRARRPGPAPPAQPHRDRARGRGLRVRSRRADRQVATDGLASSEGPRRRGSRHQRTPRSLGVVPRRSRATRPTAFGAAVVASADERDAGAPARAMDARDMAVTGIAVKHAMTTSALGRIWEWFADTSCRGYSPIYDRICRSVAGDDELLALIQESPPPAHQPNVILGVVHYLLLGGLDHPLADVYAGRSDADPAPLFRDVCLTHRNEVLALMETRRTQTNEVGRSAVIGPALTWVAHEVGAPLALLDVGTSAGLNLGCDRYLLDYGARRYHGPARRRGADRVRGSRRAPADRTARCRRSSRDSGSTDRRSTSPTNGTRAGCSRASGPIRDGWNARAPRSEPRSAIHRPFVAATWSTTCRTRSPRSPAARPRA